MQSQQLSLYIPRVFANITKDRITHIFKSLGIGETSVIDFVPREDSNTGESYNMAFVHFDKWYDNVGSQNFQDKVNDPNSDAKVVYDDPWYWICLPNLNPKPDSQRILEETVLNLQGQVDQLYQGLCDQNLELQYLTRVVESLQYGSSMEEKTSAAPVLTRQFNDPENTFENYLSPTNIDSEATSMEEGEIPDWYDNNDTTFKSIAMEELANNSLAFSQQEIAELEYEIWKNKNPPLHLPLEEGQIESDPEGMLWVFTNCNDEPIWRRIPEGDPRYDYFKNIEKIQSTAITGQA
jgi:hypothetical protein